MLLAKVSLLRNKIHLLLLIFAQLVISISANKFKAGSGGFAPYAKIQFSSEECVCHESGSTLISGVCLNTTSNETFPATCTRSPYWGMIFVTWCFSAILLAVSLTTGFTVFRQFVTNVKTVWALRRSMFTVGDAQQAKPAGDQGPIYRPKWQPSSLPSDNEIQLSARENTK